MRALNPITEHYESTQALDLILRARKAHEAATDKKTAPRLRRGSVKVQNCTQGKGRKFGGCDQ
jgi:hypothetical protein